MRYIQYKIMIKVTIPPQNMLTRAGGQTATPALSDANSAAICKLRAQMLQSNSNNLPGICKCIEKTAKTLVFNGQLPSTFSPSDAWHAEILRLAPEAQVKFAVDLAKSINGSRAPNVESLAVAMAIGLQIAGMEPESKLYGYRVSSLAGMAKTLICEAIFNVEAHIMDAADAVSAEKFFAKKLEAPVFTDEHKLKVFANVKAAFPSFFRSYPGMETKVETTVCILAEQFASNGYLAFNLLHDDIRLSRYFSTDDASGRKMALLVVPGQPKSRMIIDVTDPKNPQIVNLDKIDQSGEFLYRFKYSSNGHSCIFEPVKKYFREKADYEAKCKN